MAKVRVEFIDLGHGSSADWAAAAVEKKFVQGIDLTVASGEVSAPLSLPAGAQYVRCEGLEDNCFIHIDDGSATVEQTNSRMLRQDKECVLRVYPDQVVRVLGGE